MAKINNYSACRLEVAEPQGDILDKNWLNPLFNNQLDGIIIEGFLAPSLASALATKQRTFFGAPPYSSLLTPTPFGHVCGPTLMENDLEAYLSRAALARQAFEALFENEPAFHSPLPILHSPFSMREKPCSPAVLRVLGPGQFGLEAHIHQEFPAYFPNYAALSQSVDLSRELSLHVNLEAPESGGDLILYDMSWENTPQEWLKGELFMRPQRTKLLENIPRTTIHLDPGDAIVFASGRIWQSLEPVGGTNERVILGSFIAPSLGGDSVYCFI